MSIQLGIYRHYKNKDYDVIGVAKDSDTGEDVVVYKPLYNNEFSDLFVRKLSVFTQEVEHEGRKIRRFVYLGGRD